MAFLVICPILADFDTDIPHAVFVVGPDTLQLMTATNNNKLHWQNLLECVGHKMYAVIRPAVTWQQDYALLRLWLPSQFTSSTTTSLFWSVRACSNILLLGTFQKQNNVELCEDEVRL